MAGRKTLVSQAEIRRTLNAVRMAGLPIGIVEVDYATGRVIVRPNGTETQAAGPDPDELLR